MSPVRLPHALRVAPSHRIGRRPIDIDRAVWRDAGGDKTEHQCTWLTDIAAQENTAARRRERAAPDGRDDGLDLAPANAGA